MWGRNAEVAEKYIRKGSRLYVEGRLRTRTYEDRNKIKRYITEVIVESFEMLGGGQRANDTQQGQQQVQQPQPEQQEQNNTSSEGDVLPF
jgi:single-strand DNA-binding protein